MISVLVVDDHAAFRQSFARWLAGEPDIGRVIEAASVAEARTKLREVDVDVGVFDFTLADGTAIELVRPFLTANPLAAVLILTGSADRPQLGSCIEAGASGVLEKSVPMATIVDAIRAVAQGDLLHSPRELAELLGLAREKRRRESERITVLREITTRERDVLEALAQGFRDKEIAQRLGVSKATIRTHVASVLGKLGVESRLHAVVLAVQLGVVSIGGRIPRLGDEDER